MANILQKTNNILVLLFEAKISVSKFSKMEDISQNTKN